jgi:hypothetical protein
MSKNFRSITHLKGSNARLIETNQYKKNLQQHYQLYQNMQRQSVKTNSQRKMNTENHEVLYCQDFVQQQ